jgi:tetratricopeptide (TPR) repeat protein
LDFRRVGKLKRRNAWNIAKEAEGPSKIVVGAKIVLALLALATLCVCAAAQEETADELYKKGRDLDRNGSYEEAVKAYDRAIELEPSNATFYISKVPGLNMLAILTNNQSKFNESLQAIDKALEIDPKNPRAWELKGNALSQMKRYNESLEAYDRGIQHIGLYKGELNQTEELSGLWLGKGSVLSLWAGSINDKGLYEDAIKAFDKAIELEPQQNRGRLVKANALLNLGRYNESLKIFDEAIEAASQNFEKAQIWFEKAHLFAEQGNYNETTEALEKVFELAPQDIDLWINGGILLSAVLGRNDDALKYYESAIKIDPENKLALINKANALVKLNRTDEATGAYQEALNITNKNLEDDPENSNLWAEKGLLLHNVGNSEEAVKAFANATRIDPMDETSWKMMGVLLASELHRYDEAALAFDGALQANPEDGQVWTLKADALKALGKSAEAKAAYARAREQGYKG